MNPPYSQPEIGQFVEKIIDESSRENVDSAIVLTHNYTDTTWFQQAAGWADAICFTRGRIRFESPEGALASPTQGQAFFYSGCSAALFADVFKEIGFVVCLI